MIDEKKLIEAITKGEYTTGNILADMELQQFIKDFPKVGEWIPCSEKLPETDKNRKYLVCGEKGGIYIAEFVCKTINGDPLGMSWWSARGRYCPNPIAWQPLPEPYKE